MGVIRIHENPLDTTDFTEIEWTGPYVDFLRREFPNGFGGRPHQTLVNLKPLEVEHYDRAIGSRDDVSLIILPGAPVAAFLGPALTQIVVGVVASTILNYAINALFGPKGIKATSPVAATKGATSPETVYSFSGASNTARVGQTIPVGYGRNIMVPDVASQPYAFFLNNEQYLVQLLCLGCGDYTVHEVRVAGANATQLQAGVLTVHQIPSSVHRQTFGVIESLYGYWENVYTSPMVSDQELTATKTKVENGNYQGPSQDAVLPYKPVRFSDGYVTVALAIEMLRACFELTDDTNAYDYWQAWANGGKPCYVTFWDKVGTDYNPLYNGQVFQVAGWVVPPGPNPVIKIGFLGSTWSAYGGISGTAPYAVLSYSSDPPQQAVPVDGVPEPIYGSDVGPFIAVPDGATTQLLMYDLVFPSGCWFVQEDGNFGQMTVDVVFYATPIDANDNPIGPELFRWWTSSFGNNTPQRVTVEHAVPQGRYRVRARRRAPVSERATDQSTLIWGGLKAKLDPPANPVGVYGDVHLALLIMKATNGVASNAHQQISMVATRWEGTSYQPNEWDPYIIPSTGGELQHPISCFEDIYLRSDYGGQRPSKELDVAGLETLRAAWPGVEFNAVFDAPSTVWEAMTLALQLQHAGPVLNGAQIGAAIDAERADYDALFDESSIVSLVATYMFGTEDDPDGVEGEYKAEADGAAEYETYPPDAVNPESVELWGCRNQAQAHAFVRRAYRQRKYRRRLVVIELEADAHWLQVGQIVGVKHPLLLGATVIERVVISAIKVSDEFSTSIEGYVYQPEVYL